MLLLVSSLLITQVPASGLAVVVSRRTGVSPQRGREIAAWVQLALNEHGVLVPRDAEAIEQLAALPECRSHPGLEANW